MKWEFALLAICYCLGISAQESQYELMAKELGENSLPLVNLIVDTATVNTMEYAAGEIEISDYLCRTSPDTTTVRFHCKYRIRGGTAMEFDKKSYAVKLYDESGEDLDANILGIRDENNWILDAMSVDRTRMRNRVCFDVWNEISRTPYDTKYDNRNGIKGVFVEVFINGDYHGLYCMTDKIDRKLLGLKKAKVDNDGAVTVHGLLYKGDSWNDYTDIWLRSYSEADTNNNKWNGWELQYPEDYPSDNTWQPLMDLIDLCSDTTPDETFVQAYQDYFYTDNLVDYAVFTMALNVGDNAYKNTFLSVVDIDKGHRYLLSPWDMDQSLGGLWNGDYDETLADVYRYDHVAPFNRLAVQNINGFKEKEAKEWTRYRATLFSRESIARRLDEYAALFAASGAWDREYAKWNDKPVPLQKDIADELEYVKDWYSKNYEWLSAQFATLGMPGIIDVQPRCPLANGMVTLDGRRIDANAKQKGVYIVDGKKVVVK